jgi:hypothetical protein
MPLWRITFALSCKLPLEEVHEAAVEVVEDATITATVTLCATDPPDPVQVRV